MGGTVSKTGIDDLAPIDDTLAQLAAARAILVARRTTCQDTAAAAELDLDIEDIDASRSALKAIWSAQLNDDPAAPHRIAEDYRRWAQTWSRLDALQRRT